MIEIDRNKLYQVDDYTYKNYVTLTDDEKLLVLNWRNHPEIRKWMTNSDIIPLESHLKFIDGLKYRKDAYYWLVLKGEKPIGSLDFVDLDYEASSGVPGFYMAPDMLDSGEGFFFHYNFKELAYHLLGFDKLVGGYAEVGNVRVFAMARFFGGEPVGYFEENGKGFLKFAGTRQDFEKIDKSHVLTDFAKFARQCRKIDWNETVTIAKQKNENE